ncbi:hypothetical protein U1Q18_004560, partial [Sarracenia purpurea var. burkii]
MHFRLKKDLVFLFPVVCSARTEEGILQTVHYVTGGGPAQPRRGINGTIEIAVAASDIYFCDRSNPGDYFWKISVQRFRRRGS